MEFRGTVSVVTGGTRGIGKATAIKTLLNFNTGRYMNQVSN